MHKNAAWLVLLGAVGIVTLFFCGRAAGDLWKYYSLSAETQIKTIEWSVTQTSSHYLPHATYAFDVNGQEYHGSEDLLREWQRNEWAVHDKIKELGGYRWNVYYSPSDPSYSTLDRAFPWRDIVYAVVMLGLIIYFVGLGIYVGKQTK